MDTQIAKENAMKLAINKGYALHRVERAIYAVDTNSSYYLVSKSTDYDSLWQDAFISLKIPQELIPLTAKETDNLFDSERDKLKRSVIEKALVSRGLALFHRNNSMYGYDRDGNEVFIIESDDKDKLWQETLLKLEQK